MKRNFNYLKIWLSFFILFIFSGCASKTLNYEPKEVKSDYNATWQYSFNIAELDELIQKTLKNNENLNTAVLNLNIALRQAGLNKADLFPTPSASLSASSSRDISYHDKSKRSFSSGFGLSWELDLWGRVYNAYESANFNAKKSLLNLQDIQISIINSVISEYFNILYLNERKQNLIKNLTNMQALDKIVRQKFNLGRAELLELAQSNANLLSAQNSLKSTERELENAYEALANLTRTELIPQGYISDITRPSLDFGIEVVGDENFSFSKPQELKIAWIERILTRPDVNAKLASLNAGLYDYKIAQKNFLPKITLNGGLNDSDKNFNDAFGFNLLSGALNISLPFLDYARLKKNLKISQDQFEILRLAYKQSLNNALNEAIKYAAFYQIDTQNLKNQEKIVSQREQIVEIYNLKYNQGAVSLKDLLEAQNALISAQNTLASQKYELINDEINFYKAIAR